MTHIRILPRYCQDKHSDQVSSKYGTQMWPLECKQEVHKICSSDLVLDSI